MACGGLNCFAGIVTGISDTFSRMGHRPQACVIASILLLSSSGRRQNRKNQAVDNGIGTFLIKVFEHFEFSRVGQVQSLLESEGIRTFIRNEYSSSVVGELPFVEVVPQLYVLEAKDLPRAMELLKLDLPVENAGENWTCPDCGIDVEGNFSRCWQCGAARS